MMRVFRERVKVGLATIALLIFFGAMAVGQTTNSSSTQQSSPHTAELQKLLNAEVFAHPSLPGELLHVTAPKQGIDVSLAAGVFDRESKRPLDPHNIFRVASVTKTFVAAAILRLYEERKIKLDDTIDQH